MMRVESREREHLAHDIFLDTEVIQYECPVCSVSYTKRIPLIPPYDYPKELA
jgi:hypothetical protein